MTEPSTSILGAPNMYVSVGSTINITCVIRNAAKFPSSVSPRHAVTLPHGPRVNIEAQYCEQ